MQAKARQCKARHIVESRQGMAHRQGKADQGNSRQGKASQGNTRQGKARRQGKATHEKTKQGKVRQGKENRKRMQGT
jgi:hypothetical protein